MTKQLDVFVTGGTGYMGTRLISMLLDRGLVTIEQIVGSLVSA